MVCAGAVGSGQLCAREAFRATGGSTEQLCSTQDPVSSWEAKGSSLAVTLKYFEDFQNPLQMSLDTWKKNFQRNKQKLREHRHLIPSVN